MVESWLTTSKQELCFSRVHWSISWACWQTHMLKVKNCNVKKDADLFADTAETIPEQTSLECHHCGWVI